MTVAERLSALHTRIAAACRACGRDPAEIVLLAVSKTRPAEDVVRAVEAGQAVFGENRVQELLPKAEALQGRGIRWHMIGSVQTNKCKHLMRVPGLECVQSLDRVRLADGLQRACDRTGRQLDVLLQVDATGEATKHGVPPGSAEELLAHVQQACPALTVRGLMAMAPLEGEAAPVFASVAALAAELRTASGLPLPVLSMGMTGDLEAAVAAGSTMVRVGTGVFGPRG